MAIGWVFDDPSGSRREPVGVPRAQTDAGDWLPLHLLLARQRREFEQLSRDEGIDLHVVEYGGDDEEVFPVRCPRCGSSNLRPIVRGMPGPELVDAAERGEVVIGGCVVGELDPTRRCGGCGVELHDVGDRPVPDDLVAIRDDLPRLVQRLVDWQVDNLARQQGVGVHLASNPDVFVQWVAAEEGRGARMEVSVAAVDRREPLVADWLTTQGFVQQRLPSGRRVWAADDFDALRSSVVTICDGVFEALPSNDPLVAHPDIGKLAP